MTDQFETLNTSERMDTFLGYVEEIRNAEEADLQTVLDSIRERSGDSPFLVGGSAALLADFFADKVPEGLHPLLALLIPQDTLGDLIRHVLADEWDKMNRRVGSLSDEERHEEFDLAADIFRWDEFGTFLTRVLEERKAA